MTDTIEITAVDRVRSTARIKTTVKNGYEPGDITVELEGPGTIAIDDALRDEIILDYAVRVHGQCAAAVKEINGKVNADG